MKKEIKYKVVTPEQYEKGWVTMFNGSIPMTLVKKLPDGNYLVEEPHPEYES